MSVKSILCYEPFRAHGTRDFGTTMNYFLMIQQRSRRFEGFIAQIAATVNSVMESFDVVFETGFTREGFETCVATKSFDLSIVVHSLIGNHLFFSRIQLA